MNGKNEKFCIHAREYRCMIFKKLTITIDITQVVINITSSIYSGGGGWGSIGHHNYSHLTKADYQLKI